MHHAADYSVISPNDCSRWADARSTVFFAIKKARTQAFARYGALQTSQLAGALFRIRRQLEALSPENARNKKGVPKDAFFVGLKTTVLES